MRRPRLGRRTASALLAAIAGACLWVPADARAQMATTDRLERSGWWPTKPAETRDDYVGTAECLRCHRTKAGQPATSMALTATRAAESAVLRARSDLRVRLGRYSYAIERVGGASVFRVTDGTETRSAVLAWAFGAGNVGQTYLFERDGGLHEGRVSYYDQAGRLDFTPNRALDNPKDVTEAMSRPVETAEARRCFGCHTTASATRTGFDPSRLVPGVTCEACHGPGRRHVAAVASGVRRSGPAAILDPSELDPVDSVDFCGACHATFWDVTLAGERGLAALRSQPFRLQSSACWQGGDDRLTCVACHDPHRALVRDAGSYDVACLACHAGASSPATPSARSSRRCPVRGSDCVTCHMPKYTVPVMHYEFTDHLIRIVRR